MSEPTAGKAPRAGDDPADGRERSAEAGEGPDDRDERSADSGGSTWLRSPVDLEVAIGGGVLAAVLTFGTMYMLGSVGDLEARRLLEATLPTIRFLASAVGTAGATVLALMLTVLGLSSGMERRLRREHYVRIRQISWLAAIVLLMSIGLLTVMVVPLGEVERVPTSWFEYVYFGILGFSSLIGGATFALVIMLLNAVRGLIDVVDHTIEEAPIIAERD